MILALYLLSPVTSWACSSVIVGKDASATGRAMVSRTADLNATAARKFIVVPAGFYKGGQEYQLLANGFKFTFSHDSYKYTAVPSTTRRALDDSTLASGNADAKEAASKDISPHWEDGFHINHESSGVNEKGLVVSGTNTTSLRSSSNTGMTTGGGLWTEPAMVKVLLAEAATCKEAMDVVDGILASGQGMGPELMQIADPNEAWLLEAVGRNHYVASRVPDDSFAMIANGMRHQYFDENDPANFRSNFKPNTYAIDNGFARYQSEADKTAGKVNISLTYGAASLNGSANSYRVWRGMTVFAPSQGSDIKVLTEADYYGGTGLDNDTSKDVGGVTYPVYIKPDKKISAMDITWLQRDRYAGTTFDTTYAPQARNGNGTDILAAGEIRPIGHFTHRFTHVFEVSKGAADLPPEIGSRFWIAMAAAETSVNLPFYGNITDTHPMHKYDIKDPNTATTGLGLNNVPYSGEDTKKSAFMLFARIGYLARADRKNYVAPIQAFWRDYELKLDEDQTKVIEPEVVRLYKEVSPEASAKFATDYTIAVSDRAFRAAIKILDALEAHVAAAPNTLFEIPAELIEPTINETALRSPADEDKKAVLELGGYSLLTRDDGNIHVESISAGSAPDVSDYKFDLPGSTVDISLKPEQVIAKQAAGKLLYEVDLSNDFIETYGGLDKLKKNLAFVMSAGGNTLKLVGPDSDALISFSDALAKGIATLTLTSNGAIVGLEYILVDEAGVSGIYNNRLVACDGAADGALSGSIWLATSTAADPDPDPDPKSNGSGGCNYGVGILALGALAVMSSLKRKRK
jgi:dipeptidase